jgi:type VI secretion system FHA domain protein
MALTLSVLRCPDAVPPETRTVTGGEFSIGRGPDNQWTLADPDKFLSKRHCVLAFRSGGWQLADVSTNGTFLNRDTDPVGATPRDLRDGDRLRLGNYEIEIRVNQEEAGWSGGQVGGGHAAPGDGGQIGGGQIGGGFADPFGDDPFAPPANRGGAGSGFGAGGGFGKDPLIEPGGFGGLGQQGVALPPDFDPLGADFEQGFAAPTQSDHSSPLEQAFHVPTPSAAPGLPPDLDDWDLDLTPKPPSSPPPPATPFAPPPAAAPQAAPPPPVPPPPAPPPPAPPADPLGFDDAPFAAPTAAPVVPAPPAAVPPPAEHPADGSAHDPFAEPDVASAPFVPAVPPPAAPPPRARPPQPAAGDDALLAAFLRGAGMADARPADALATMQQLGAAFRAVVSGIRQTLIARATVKGEFRIEQTQIRARGNNPLKFSMGDDDALASLLGAGRKVDMAPAAAIADALSDIRLHELATMAAMQSAVRALMQRLDPAPLRAEGERAGGLLGAQKRARAFESFEKLHGEISRALADDFDSVFGKAFARAYEQALHEASDRDPPT